MIDLCIKECVPHLLFDVDAEVCKLKQIEKDYIRSLLSVMALSIY